MSVKIIAIIPARLQSTRLPEKVLADIGGSSMIKRVYSSVKSSGLFDQVVVATDSEKVMTHCLEHNIGVMVTSVNHSSGTDRVAEVAELMDADIVINVQADEPFIEKECLVSLVNLMKREEVTIGTLSKEIKSSENLLNYNVVKLVKDINDKVLYFSRQAVPAQRDLPYRQWLDHAIYFQHLGIYGFKKNTLLEVTKLEQTPLEQSEKLEQLRWLSNGYQVYAVNVDSESFGIDTDEDLERARTHILRSEFKS